MWAKLTAPPEAPGDGEPSSGSVPPGTHTWAHHGLHVSPKLRSVEELAPVAAGLVPNSPPTTRGAPGAPLYVATAGTLPSKVTQVSHPSR